LPVAPEVLKLWAAGHARARLLRAAVADCPVDEVDAVEEVDNWGKNTQAKQDVNVWSRFLFPAMAVCSFPSVLLFCTVQSLD
jgi:hypothetical protein